MKSNNKIDLNKLWKTFGSLNQDKQKIEKEIQLITKDIVSSLYSKVSTLEKDIETLKQKPYEILLNSNNEILRCYGTLIKDYMKTHKKT